MSQTTIKHIVLFSFKESTNEDLLEQIHAQLLGLQETVKVLQAIEGGVDVSDENLHGGFSHCYVMTFASMADKNKYLQDTGFIALRGLLGDNLEKILVMDYRM